MKRPLAACGAAFLAAQIFAALAGRIASSAMCVFMVFLSAASFSLLKREHRKIVLPVLVSCVAALGIFSLYDSLVVEKSRMLEGHTVYISGTIVDAPYESNNRYYYVVKTDYIEHDGAPQNIKIRVSNRTALDAEVTDIFEGYVVVNEREKDESFSSRTGRIARGITATAYIEYSSVPQITEGRHGFRYKINCLREAVAERISLIFPSDLAALLRGVLLGDKSEMKNSVRNDFRICGLSHLLAVSGLHMSIIVYALMTFLQQFRIHYRAVAGIVLALLWCYIALTGFSYSILRAGIMYSLMLIARAIKRNADNLNSLGAALLVVCIGNPYAAADAGLLLSVSSTAGLIFLHKPVLRRVIAYTDKLKLEKYPRLNKGIINAASTVATSIIASACTFPVTALYFGEYSLISPLANLLCVKLSEWFMVSGAVALILSYIPLIGSLLCGLVSAINWLTGKLLLLIIELLADIPNASINVNYNFMPVFIFAAIFMLAAWYVLFWKTDLRTKVLKTVCIMIAAMLLLGIFTEEALYAGKHTVWVYSVEDGISVVAGSSKSCVVIGTGGDRYSLWKMTMDMQDNNLSRVDAVFYPNSENEYASYAPDFIEETEPQNIFMPPVASASDELAFAIRGYDNDRIFGINNASYKAENDDLEVITYTEAENKIWILLDAGDIEVIICPEGGDFAALPEEIKRYDCAVMLSEDIINLHAMNDVPIIVSADTKDSAHAVAILRYRGAERVFDTSSENIIITEHSAGIMVRGD